MTEYNIMRTLTEIIEKEKIRRTLTKIPVQEQLQLYLEAIQEYRGSWKDFNLYKQIYDQYHKKKKYEEERKWQKKRE
jgi:hypothetical protein